MLGLGLAGKVIGGVTGFFTRKQERKMAESSAKSKLMQSKQDGTQTIQLNDSEWEALSKKAEDGTWKDEYVTIIITMPIPLIMLGAIVAAFTGNTQLLDGVNQGIVNLTALGLDMGELMWVVVLAAVSVKGYKSL
tara:strand:+ start:25262 stop:25666 length:405 start_codon:yes stop_codon:yes gene_type:complete